MDPEKDVDKSSLKDKKFEKNFLYIEPSDVEKKIENYLQKCNLIQNKNEVKETEGKSESISHENEKKESECLENAISEQNDDETKTDKKCDEKTVLMEPKKDVSFPPLSQEDLKSAEPKKDYLNRPKLNHVKQLDDSVHEKLQNITTETRNLNLSNDMRNFVVAENKNSILSDVNEIFRQNVMQSLSKNFSITFEKCEINSELNKHFGILNINQTTSIGIKTSSATKISKCSSSSSLKSTSSVISSTSSTVLLQSGNQSIQQNIELSEVQQQLNTTDNLEPLEIEKSLPSSDVSADTTVNVENVTSLQDNDNDVNSSINKTEVDENKNKNREEKNFELLQKKFELILKENNALKKAMEKRNKDDYDDIQNKHLKEELSRMKNRFIDIQKIIMKQQRKYQVEKEEHSTQTWASTIICDNCVKTLEMLRKADVESLLKQKNKLYYVLRSDYNQLQNLFDEIKREVIKRETDYENRKEKIELNKLYNMNTSYRMRLHELETQNKENHFWLNTLQQIIAKIYCPEKVKNLNYAEQKWVDRILQKYNNENFTIKTDDKDRNV